MGLSTISGILFGVKILGDRSIPLIHALGTLAVVYAIALFVGLLICSKLNWGFGFENLLLDAAKCLAVGAVVTGAFWLIEAVLIGQINVVPHVRLFMLAVIYLSTKACWLTIKFGENLLANAIAMAAGGVVIFVLYERVAP